MTWAAIGAAAIGAAGSIYSSSQARKAAQAGAGAANNIDISKVITEARTAAEDNLKNSISLENRYRPGTAMLRNTVDSALGNLAAGNTLGFQARDQSLLNLFSQGGGTGINDLLKESTDRILGQLRLGGQLDPETQNAVMRGALEGAGTAGISGSGASRGLAARDLGLTSIQLMNQRQQAGLTAGSALQSAQLANLTSAMNLAGQDTQRTGLLAGIIDARALPESGLSAGAIANLYTGKENAMAQAAANQAAINAKSRSDNMNALLGFGSTAFTAYMGNRKPAGNADPFGD